MKTSTMAVQIGVGKDPTGAMSFPIYQNATFSHPAFGQSTGYDYSLSGNPTRKVLEEGIARLDGGVRCFAYASGMAAITNLLLLFNQGDHLVVTEDLYGGTFRVIDKVFARQGLTASYVDTSDPDEVGRAIRDCLQRRKRRKPVHRATGPPGKPEPGGRPGFRQPQHRQPALPERDGLEGIRGDPQPRRDDFAPGPRRRRGGRPPPC